MQDQDLVGKALEQLPALVISLGAFLFMLVKGMAFLRAQTTTFVKHQESRDKLMHEQLLALFKDGHDWADRREAAMAIELRASREAIETGAVAQAVYETTMVRVAAALERTG